MIIYQSLEKNKSNTPKKKHIKPGVNGGQPMDGICHLPSTNQTTCNCNVENPVDYIFIKEDASKLKEYVMKKDLELSNKINALNSKFIQLEKLDIEGKLDKINEKLNDIETDEVSAHKTFNSKLNALEKFVKTIKYEGNEAIEVTEIPDSSIKQISLKISPHDKVISQSLEGLIATMKIEYLKEEKRIRLVGKADSEITTCDLDFVPEKVYQVKENGKTYLKFEYSDENFFLVDINQFLDIKYDGDGCFTLNGKRVGIKVAKDDQLLYVDDVHALRSKNLSDLEEWKKLQEQVEANKKRTDSAFNSAKQARDIAQQALGVAEDASAKVGEFGKDIMEIKLKVDNGGSYTDPTTGETINVESIKDQIIGSKDDEIKIDETSGEIDQSTISINSIIKYIDDKSSQDYVWNEA